MKLIAQYLYNIFLLTSQTFSVLLGGHPDRSISQRTGEAYLAHKNTGTLKELWFTHQMKLIDALFYNRLYKLEKNHCINSLSGEAGAKEIWDWKG
jgi:hypothetical protein